jgi:SNF2 family DNA or RNA helicase
LQRINDAVSILDFVAPGLCDPGEMIAGLRRALSVVQLRRRRVDVLPDLPPKTVFQITPELLPVQRAAYDIAHREGLVWLHSLGAELWVTHVLELILRLKQICRPPASCSTRTKPLGSSTTWKREFVRLGMRPYVAVA